MPLKLICGKTWEIIPSFGPPLELGKCKTWEKYEKNTPSWKNAEPLTPCVEHFLPQISFDGMPKAYR